MQDHALIQSVPKTFVITLEAFCDKSIDKSQITKAAEQIVYQHNQMIKNHQVVEGTARWATIRLYCIQLLEGQNIDSPTRVAVGRKDRWPSILNELRPFFYRVRDYKCINSDRIIRSLLYLNRLCEGNSVVDTTEITKSFTISEEFKERYRTFIKSKMSSSFWKPGELISSPTLKVISSGPNSKPKWQTAELEAYVLMHSEYAPHFEALCQATGNLDLYKFVKHRASLIDKPT